MENLRQSYYMKSVKIIRDLVHEYVNLTRFDLKLIDTVPFQRLGDVRQLTCQHVYPAARHTRLEHSLGVQELMRNAIKYLNRNGILGNPPKKNSKPIISEKLEFNASVAALLHDVGHCPFSHMGETEFNKKEVQNMLICEVEEHDSLKECEDLIKRLKTGENIGSVHEQLSCIVILRKYSDMLLNLTELDADGEDSCNIETDFELIIRSILGIEYDVSTGDAFTLHKEKNVIVRLLNSKIFDVDKLDYIIRDSYLTGIGTPAIDTQRLFRNMYLDKSYSLVFTSRAVPALQNMIDARDGLYMYVYNHHAVVYSDFLNTYISRRLSHNAKAFYRAAYPTMTEKELEAVQETAPIYSVGIVPKSYLFSVDAIVEEQHADSAWLSLLNVIHINYQKMLEGVSEGDFQQEIQNSIQLKLRGELRELEEVTSVPDDPAGAPLCYRPISAFSSEVEKALSERVYISMQLIHQSMTRFYLKPWWKTVFEYTNFMNHYFQDDRIRRKLGKYICDGGDYGLEEDEFRSQIAKCVTYITKEIERQGQKEAVGLLDPLNEGEFFVVQRSPRFFSPDTIEKIEIALKNNEILGPPADVDRRENEYYLKSLTNIIPQKEYSSIYAREGFYIFSKQITAKETTQEKKNRHYELLERVFAFVAKELVNIGEYRFAELFQERSNETAEERQTRQKNENEFKAALYGRFMSQIPQKGYLV